VLLAPGQRLGYLAISPLMPAPCRRALQDAMFPTQLALGWCFPNAVMQYAVPDLEGLSIDMAALHRKRDRMSRALEACGYEVLHPEGTFYLFCRCPGADETAFWHALADRDVFVMPGHLMQAPGYFRVSLTASAAMIERSLPAFADAAARMR
jgi:aspartate aminotransferase